MKKILKKLLIVWNVVKDIWTFVQMILAIFG